jgi:hypothetical protein
MWTIVVWMLRPTSTINYFIVLVDEIAKMPINNIYQDDRNKDFDKNKKRNSLEDLNYEEAKNNLEMLDESLTI